MHEYGPNVVQPKKPNPIWKVLQWFFGGFGLLLFGAGIAALLAWQPFCPSCTANLGIFGICMFVVLINGFFNAFQEWSSSKGKTERKKERDEEKDIYCLFLNVLMLLLCFDFYVFMFLFCLCFFFLEG